MFNSYADIFNIRGAAYHQAMQQYPTARDEEFVTMIRLLQPAPGQTIVDMPSGGGYLRGYLTSDDIELIAIETTQAFFDQCREDETTQARLCELSDTGLPDGSVDAVVSIAGLHHVEDRVAVFGEIYRILKDDGKFCIADVEKGSPTDGFLNTFVDKHNSMGHEGLFIDDTFRKNLQQTGFEINIDRSESYCWNFVDADEMIDYCILMFGLDEAEPDQVREGIKKYQGFNVRNGRCRMNWSLRFIRCGKK